MGGRGGSRLHYFDVFGVFVVQLREIEHQAGQKRLAGALRRGAQTAGETELDGTRSFMDLDGVAAVVDTVLAKNANARICIAAIALESLSAAITALTAHGLSAEVTQLAVSRTRPAGRLHLLTANNPIFLITGERK